MNTEKILAVACIGCGARGQTYTELAARRPDRFRIVAGADPVPERVEKVRGFAGSPDFRGFPSGEALLEQPRLADLAIVSTQDGQHHGHARRALELGYDLLLEKPAATRMEDILDLERLAARNGRRVMVCFVLRFAPFYRAVKRLLESGAVGDIVSIQANEGVGLFHQAHSFVRGHWSVVETSSPMIVAKCCHDTDLLHWLLGRPCRSVASFGSLAHFRPEHAPAGAPERCTDGCPVAASCPCNALRYTTDKRANWLPMVFDRAASATTAEIEDWLRTSPWGRCAYRCGNTAVDHQVLAMEFEGGVTATFTMTAFETGRHIEIYGTRGVLRGGHAIRRLWGDEIVVVPHEGEPHRHSAHASGGGGYAGHGGGDEGLVEALYDEMTRADRAPEAGLASAVHGHAIGFAAEESRRTGQTVEIATFVRRVDEDSRCRVSGLPPAEPDGTRHETRCP